MTTAQTYENEAGQRVYLPRDPDDWCGDMDDCHMTEGELNQIASGLPATQWEAVRPDVPPSEPTPIATSRWVKLGGEWLVRDESSRLVPGHRIAVRSAGGVVSNVWVREVVREEIGTGYSVARFSRTSPYAPKAKAELQGSWISMSRKAWCVATRGPVAIGDNIYIAGRNFFGQKGLLFGTSSYVVEILDHTEDGWVLVLIASQSEAGRDTARSQNEHKYDKVRD